MPPMIPSVFTRGALNLDSGCRCDVGYIHPFGRILSGVAGRAECELFALAASLLQSIKRKVGERIRADVLADLFHILVRGDELVFRRRVHSVETWRDGRRA